jgi:hypothetical protein
MNDGFSEHSKKFEELMKDVQILLSIARDSDLQRAAVVKLTDFLRILGEWKYEAIAETNEDRANLILGMECAVKSFRSELEMWLLLKAEKPEEAWGRLVSAQSETSHATRAHRDFEHLEYRANYLEMVEKLIFPPQVFMSMGMIVRKQICTICEKDYEECSHLVGMPYWGEFCFRRLVDISPDHVSLVKNPANKHCRVTHFDVEGGVRNRMTWRVEPKPNQSPPKDNKKGLQARGILLAESDLKS